MDADVEVRRLQPEDRPAWEVLWREYLEFYETELDALVTDETWQRVLVSSEVSSNGSTMLGFGAFEGDRLVGFAHVIVGPNTWSPRSDGYLEDLGVAADARGRGVGHALVAALREHGRAEGWRRLHWITEGDNERAMRLYDDVARRTDYVRYELDLD